MWNDVDMLCELHIAQQNVIYKLSFVFGVQLS